MDFLNQRPIFISNTLSFIGSPELVGVNGFTIHSRSLFTGVTCGETNFGLPYFGVENLGFGDFKGDLFIGDLKFYMFL